VKSWDAWGWDAWTAAWVVWIVWFIVVETLALWLRPGQELTAHIRPLFVSYPLTWFLGLGLWLWLGVHFLLPHIERSFWKL
jgi:hypothetical protein